MQADNQLILDHLDQPIFHLIGEVADAMNRPCFVIGGYVRDIFLNRPSKDIDIVTLGSGIELAEALTARLGKRAHLSTFRNFGTAQVKYNRRGENFEIEFVGARKESYSHDSRKPVVEDGTLQDDQNRRDFTINALALCLNRDRWGELVDPFGGMDDLERGIIRTPLDPDITFSDDPLRMMRAIRFATQLNFRIETETFAAIERNRSRIEIISKERIIDELGKIIRSDIPSKGFILLDDCKLLPLIFPEVAALKGVETVKGRGHKDNFYHSLAVLDNDTSVYRLGRAMQKYADTDGIPGGFMQIGDRYRELDGRMIWCGDKPFISARKSLWHTHDDGLTKEAFIKKLADEINAMPADPTSENGYSYINIHPWSMTIADVDLFVSLLDEHIEIVSAEEMLHLVKTNVRH